MKSYIVIIFSLFLVLFTNCNPNKVIQNTKESASISKLSNKNAKLNINILLDLSDRIESEEQRTRDLGYIQDIAKTFNQHVRSKSTSLYNDHLQLFFEPELHNHEINNIAKSLKFHLNRNTQKKHFSEVESKYKDQTAKLYQKAKGDASTRNGADIHHFFEQKVKNNCIKAKHRNILIVLTDGFLFQKENRKKEGNKTSYLNSTMLNQHFLRKGNWRQQFQKQKLGFIKAQEDLSNLEILVLGIDKGNHKNPYAVEVIRHYWESWFTDMNVKRFKIVESEIASDIENVISDFVHKT